MRMCVILTLAYLAGVLVSASLGHVFWWVGLVGTLPLMMGMWFGYQEGHKSATAYYRRLMRNTSNL